MIYSFALKCQFCAIICGYARSVLFKEESKEVWGGGAISMILSLDSVST